MRRLLSLVALGAVTLGMPATSFAGPLARANVVLASARSVDLAGNTVTLPLHRGTAKGQTVWYIVTDTSDPKAASQLGILYAPLIANAGDAIAQARGSVAALDYPGTVDFSPSRVLTTDAQGGPTAAKPGSIGDADYSPLVRVGEGPVYNAPIVAAGDAPHDIANHTDTLDRVVAIDTRDAARATVTLVLARGFTSGEPIAYISTDASEEGPAAIERSTYAPRLKKLQAGAIPIDVLFNGPSQGIPFAALHGHLAASATAANAGTIGSPLNVQATFPVAGNTASGYTPLWNVNPAVWTKAALGAHKDSVLRSQSAFGSAASSGLLTAPDGKPFGPTNIVVNCPVVAFADKRPA